MDGARRQQRRAGAHVFSAGRPRAATQRPHSTAARPHRHMGLHAVRANASGHAPRTDLWEQGAWPPNLAPDKFQERQSGAYARNPFNNRDSAPGSVEGADSAPPDPLVGEEGASCPSPRTPPCPRPRPFEPFCLLSFGSRPWPEVAASDMTGWIRLGCAHVSVACYLSGAKCK